MKTIKCGYIDIKSEFNNEIVTHTYSVLILHEIEDKAKIKYGELLNINHKIQLDETKLKRLVNLSLIYGIHTKNITNFKNWSINKNLTNVF